MKKILVITYYWPPAGGSGVQRWMYFCKYLKDFDIEPVVITVDEKKASYRYVDKSFNEIVKNIKVYRTSTREPLKLYSRFISGTNTAGIPIGFAGESNPSFFQKISRAIRGNFFIPDARIGWTKFALQKAREILNAEKIDLIVTNGPPHSTHLAGLKLKSEYSIAWVADFRDPWTELYYNRFLYRTKWALQKDATLEKKVLQGADLVLTVGPSMKKHLVKKGEINADKVFFVYNGYERNDFKFATFENNPEHFTISHIGMLSDSQPITSFLRSLQTFYNHNHPVCRHLKLRFIGNVSRKIIDEVIALVPSLTFEYKGYVSKKDAISSMLSSDLLLNSLAEMENSELLISGKLMEYIAAGKPVLCLGNPTGDASELLREFKYGAVFDRKDINMITEFLDQIFENWLHKIPIPFTEEKILQYSRYETTKQLANLLKKYL